MVQARRAKAQPARIIIPLAVAAALLVGGLFAAWKFWPTATTAGPQAASSTTVAESQAPSIAESSPTPSATADPASAASAKALEECQAKVNAADKVLKEGEDGVSNWMDHVQVQTDAFAGKLTDKERKTAFAKTRVKGPGDLKSYKDALDAYENLEGSCDTVDGAESTVAAALKKCNERSEAQEPVLKATAAGMDDWKTHVKFMQYNKEHPDPDAAADRQTDWMKQYRGAPKNIKAFKKATANFKAPDC